MRIVVTNAVLTNSGDAAIFQGIEESLKSEYPAELLYITILDNNANVSSKLYPDWKILQQPAMAPASGSRLKRLVMRSGREIICTLLGYAPGAIKILQFLDGRNIIGEFGIALNTLAEADLVISSGGTYFVDHYDFRPRVTELKLAFRLGKPVVLWTQSMGPFKSKRARKTIAKLNGTLAACYFRDQRSLEAWETILPKPAISRVVPDVVLSLNRANKTKSTSYMAGAERKQRVAISVRDWGLAVDGGAFSYETYSSALREAVIELDSLGYECVAVSTCQGTPGYSVDDARIATNIFAGLPVRIDSDHHSPDELMVLLEDFDLVLATRMHLAILSLVTQIPVIAIAYETKTQELFDGLGLGRNVISIENLNAEWILDRISESIQNPSQFQLTDSTLESLQYTARTPAREILSLITSSAYSNAPD